MIVFDQSPAGAILQVLTVTSEWPSKEVPHAVPFLVKQVEAIARARVAIRVFHFQGRRKLSNYLKAWWALRRHLASHPYDVIHAHWGQGGAICVPSPVPLVVTFHGSDLEGIIGPNGKPTWSGVVLKRLSRAVASQADEVVAVSDRLATLSRAKSWHVLSAGVDLTLFQPMSRSAARRSLGLRQDRKVVLFAGNPSNPVKQFELAQAAIEQIPEGERPELLVASGVAHERMPDYLNACDLLLITSAHEGSPTVVKEALGCNTPVVSVSVGDIGERIGKLESCRLCLDRTPATIARAVREVLVHAPFERESKSDLRSTVLAEDHGVLAVRLIGIYREAISRRQKLLPGVFRPEGGAV